MPFATSSNQLCEQIPDSKSMTYPDYPFTPQRFEVRPGIAMSYLDEGPRDGEVVVMVHGNPSWSYYWRHLRSEEHTSELQSLMRISYAVFCLTKKKSTYKTSTHN